MGGRGSGGRPLRTIAIEAADLAGDLDDKVFAINVNLFWAGPAAEALDRLRRQLRPHGALYLCYEPPASRVDELTDKLITTLRSNGLITDVLTATAQPAAPKLWVIGRTQLSTNGRHLPAERRLLDVRQ